MAALTDDDGVGAGGANASGPETDRPGDGPGGHVPSDAVLPPTSDAPDRARALVLDAFAAARRSGKASWDTMTTAVLKNRLLDLTGRTFAEADYGARDMAAFAKGMPDLVELVPPAGSGPPLVRLVERESVDRAVPVPPGRAEGSPRPGGRVRVRPDLWRAALDWHAAGRLVLDDGRVRPRADGDDPALPSFEPVAETVFEHWKRDFVDAVLPDVQGPQADALLAWAGRPAPANTLGRALQDRWMDTLRAKVLEHLRGWFDGQGLQAPADLVYDEPAAARPAADATGGPGDDAGPGTVAPSRRLKDFVLRCVHEMTEDELRALPIPAGVASRVRA
jgi:hypothetical protein